ncbi:methyltransferase [Defluviimonas sp. WL0050]|uniref:Methyltransferase n=1 Tax=Albidovulum litorale TaxID=2984134 RepID=A0ABT2ZSG8_9RHOB|nr:methyltransferase [Defluviimonas sp. WL0050]MCV2874093.1 methyltransferase [Defluviimonas sp. WL0050]
MFAEAELTCDGFLGGRLRIWQPVAGYRAAMDPVLMAAAVPARMGQSVLELGCGAGVASLCLGARVAGLDLTGLELQLGYAALARRNAEANGQSVTVFEGDLGAPPPGLRALSFDHVIANPPYFATRDGTPAADAGRERAQREATPIATWMDAATRRLRPGGHLTVIQAAERLPDLLRALDNRVGEISVLPVAPRIGRPAGRVILRARKGARGAFRLLPPFILHEGAEHQYDGDDLTLAARAILRDGAGLDLPR